VFCLPVSRSIGLTKPLYGRRRRKRKRRKRRRKRLPPCLHLLPRIRTAKPRKRRNRVKIVVCCTRQRATEGDVCVSGLWLCVCTPKSLFFVPSHTLWTQRKGGGELREAQGLSSSARTPTRTHTHSNFKQSTRAHTHTNFKQVPRIFIKNAQEMKIHAAAFICGRLSPKWFERCKKKSTEKRSICDLGIHVADLQSPALKLQIPAPFHGRQAGRDTRGDHFQKKKSTGRRSDGMQIILFSQVP